jgi:formate hydrogenlyase transcriptional activator
VAASHLTLEERVRFETLLADLSAQFVNLDADLIDGAIEDALRRLGELLDVDRGAVTQLADDEHTLVFTQFWSRTGETAPYLQVDAGQVFPYGLSVLMRREVYRFSRLDELPADSPDRVLRGRGNHVVVGGSPDRGPPGGRLGGLHHPRRAAMG